MDGLPLHVLNRIGAAAGQRHNVIFPVARARAAREPRGWAGMLVLKFVRHSAGPVLGRRKRAGMGKRQTQRDQKAGSCHRLLMPDDPDEQGRKNRGAEDYAERGLGEIAARRYSRELRHDKLQVAFDRGEVGTGLIDLPQRERALIGHAPVLAENGLRVVKSLAAAAAESAADTGGRAIWHAGWLKGDRLLSAVPAPAPDRAEVEPRMNAVAVELDLVQPAVAFRRRFEPAA
jgi:hypothetical protein